MAYTIGIDYGSNSVRSIVVRCSDGMEVGSSVFEYPSGEMGILLDPIDHNLARQHPGDYIAGLESATRHAIAEAGQSDHEFSPEKVIGIGVDRAQSLWIRLIKPWQYYRIFKDDWRPNVGFGKTIRAQKKRRRLRTWAANIGPNTWRSAVILIRPSGSGQKSGIA